MNGMTTHSAEHDTVIFSISVEDDHFHSLPLTRLQSVVLPVLVIKPDTVERIGTAFMIAKHGVLLTAGHVVLEAQRMVDESPGSWAAVLWIHPDFGPNDSQLIGGPVPVRFMHFSTDHDVAAIQIPQVLQNGKPIDYPTVALDMRTPETDSRIFGVGYTKMTVTRFQNSPELLDVCVDQSIHGSDGSIVEVFRTKRDSSMMPFPSFQTTARFDPGMSGGPTFSGSSGRVCGLICTGFTESDVPDDGHTSFGAMIVNAFGLPVVLNTATGETASILDLIQSGHVNGDQNFAAAHISKSEDGHIDLWLPE